MTRRFQRRSRHRALSAAVAIGVAALGGGCASIQDHRGYVMDSALADAIQPGIDNRTSVERTLGRPTLVSQFGRQDWYYVSINTRQKPFTRPRTVEEQVLRVRFDPQCNVAAVDRAGRENVVHLDPEGDKTPTLGRERGIIEDLFGNIGAVGAPGMSPQSGGPPGS
jgi:outer membrane protein assembly factor BamE (lipoprotein component of BamABCDE complex)